MIKKIFSDLINSRIIPSGHSGPNTIFTNVYILLQSEIIKLIIKDNISSLNLIKADAYPISERKDKSEKRWDTMEDMLKVVQILIASF